MRTVIPTNYTDAGKIMGSFDLRNAVEAVIIGIPLVFLVIVLSPFGLRATIITGAAIIVPSCGFCLIGIYDYSLFTFLRIFLKWQKNRRVIHYRDTRRIRWKKIRKAQKKKKHVKT